MTEFLHISNLSKRYGQIHALRDVSFWVKRGASLALLGPNGAGKSTLFGCLLGLTFPTSGIIRWNGAAITEAERRRIGYVAERVALYPQRNVIENTCYFAQLNGYSTSEAREQLHRVGLEKAFERKVSQLSKGMLQRVGLAIALCGQPELLVLDEPFNGLDPALLDVLQQILEEEKRRGATLLISTHTISAVEPLASDVAILLSGKLEQCGTLEELRAEHPNCASLESIYHQVARSTARSFEQEVFA